MEIKQLYRQSLHLSPWRVCPRNLWASNEEKIERLNTNICEQTSQGVIFL